MAGQLTRPGMFQETLRRGVALGLCPAVAAAWTEGRARAAAAKSRLTFYPARHSDKLDRNRIKCTLCPRECVAGDRERGFWGARENRDGACHTLVWGQVVARNIDPIERKPLFHFLPGSRDPSRLSAYTSCRQRTWPARRCSAARRLSPTPAASR